MGCCSLAAIGLGAAALGGGSMLGGDDEPEKKPLRAPSEKKLGPLVKGKCWGCKHHLPRQPKFIVCSSKEEHELPLCPTCHARVEQRIPNFCPMCKRSEERRVGKECRS